MRNYVLVYDINSGENVDIANLLEIQDTFHPAAEFDDTSLVEIQDEPTKVTTGTDFQHNTSAGAEAPVSQSNSISLGSININSVFWNKNGLVFCARFKQQSMNYIYKPGLKKAEAF